MGTSPPFPLAISEFEKTCGIGKMKHQDTIGISVRIRREEISELHQVEVHTTKKSPN